MKSLIQQSSGRDQISARRLVSLVGRITLAALACAATLFLSLGSPLRAADLLTRAEQTAFQATSTYDDVMKFCQELTRQSTSVTLSDFGKSVEGRSLPLLVLSQSSIRSPADLPRGVKPVILCTADIHGGEVCGKEALLILAREIAQAKDHPLLRDFILLFVPILNPDGNERFSATHRPEQNGPPEVGQRANADGLDLNRDFTKLATPEVRALARLIQQWDPIIVIDTHATDGSYHRYHLTYDGPRHPATHPAIVDLVKDTFLPEVGRLLKEKSGYDSFFYGNFEEKHARWETFPALPRYGTHYIGLRDRISLLSEAYSHAPFQERVLVTQAFVKHCIATASARKEAITELLEKVRKESASARPLPLRSQLVAEKKPVTIKGFVEDPAGQETMPVTPRDYTIEWRAGNKITRQVEIPSAYFFSKEASALLTNLQWHGVEVDELREDLDLDLQRYLVTDQQRDEKPTQQCYRQAIEVRATNLSERLTAGTYVVRTDQKLGRLASYLLEPEATDGLASWGFCDVRRGKLFPVARWQRSTPLLTAKTRRLPQDRSFHRRLDFETYSRRLNFGGVTAPIEAWLPGGTHFLQVRAGQLMRVEATSGRAQQLVSVDATTKAIAALPGISAETARTISQRPRFEMNPDFSGALFEQNDDLYFFRFDGSAALRLTQTPGKEEVAAFSPDGRWIAFVRSNNLFVVDLATQTERALTTDGGPEIRNGKADWVYFEEIYNRKWRAFWWSPDSSRIAFHRFDDSALPFFHALNTLPLHGRFETMRHPKAGDPNPEIKLGVAAVTGTPIQWANLETYPPGSYLISRVGWMPESDAVYFYVQNRQQTWLDFNTWKPETSRFQRRFRETSPAWVDDPGAPFFLSPDALIFLSERDGWRHLYRFDLREETWQRLTSGPWEVRQVHQIDQTNGWIYFSATRDQLIAENFYRCRLDGSALQRLTAREGHHQISLNPTATLFSDTVSDYLTPAKIQLCRADGTALRTLDSNPVYLAEEFDFGRTELLQIKARDGFELEASIVYPPDFSPQFTYPVWLTTYAGPKAPVVQNEYSRSRAYDQMLAQLGLIVFRIDPRSASGKGAIYAWKAYRQLGVQELADISDGLAWLKKKPYVDGSRIGMSGFSYGGFMTAYALTHSKLFAAGIAGSSVTDWTYYDSIYTERYMDLPKNNPDGYRKSSVVRAASDLHGRLLILHGMMDDNVHLQNSVALVDALQKANKPFDVMFYPEMKHGLSGSHFDRLTVDFIRRTMKLEEKP